MQPKTYLNFDLSIQLDESGGLQVVVLDSPAGEADELHDWPFSDQDLEMFLLRIGHTRRGVRRIGSPEMEAAQGFGEELYQAIFAGQIGTSFERSLDEAERRGQGLRLRLRTDQSPELSDVPWEFLYSTPLHRFLTVSTATPLVRYIEQPRMIPALAVDEAVRILTMVSSPTDVADLDVENEWARINESLSDLTRSGLIDLRRLPEATMRALQRELRQGQYHVFHFIGHGAFDARSDEGVLMFEDDQRRGHQVSGDNLGTILHDHESLRLVVLNSCEGVRSSPRDPFGGTAQGLVRQGIPAVIGMQFEITDDAAITFSHDFYSAIADGYPVDAALTEARKAIFASGNDVEWGTPVLYMRTPDGRIFDRPKPMTPPPPESADDPSDRSEETETESAPEKPPVPDTYSEPHREQLAAPAMSVDDQAKLAAVLRIDARDHKLHDEAITLLGELRARRDISLAVAEEIDTFLAMSPRSVQASVGKQPKGFVTAHVTSRARRQVTIELGTDAGTYELVYKLAWSDVITLDGKKVSRRYASDINLGGLKGTWTVAEFRLAYSPDSPNVRFAWYRNMWATKLLGWVLTVDGVVISQEGEDEPDNLGSEHRT